MRKLTPVALTTEQSQEASTQLGVQEAQKAAPKSRDPLNFPVYEVPVNKKVLIYVPNHIVQDADGVDRLRMDTPLIHAVQIGKNFANFRCTSGIVIEGTSFRGECPLCDGTSEPWDLANFIIEEKCRQQGLDPEDTEAEAVKAIRSAAFSDRKVKDAMRYYTFPVVRFETVNDDGKTFVKDDDGNMKYTVEWYTISESQWEKTWQKTLEGMEDEPTHPGGNFFLMNYCYTPKRGEPNKRDSARALVVSSRKIKNSEKMREVLDKQTEAWTPEKAREVVINNALYSVEDLQSVTDDALEGTRNLLALYNASKAGVAAGLEENGDNFKLEKKEDEETPAAGGVDAGETDLDMD